MTIWEISEKAGLHRTAASSPTGPVAHLLQFAGSGDHVIESAPASRHELRAGQRTLFRPFEHFRIYVTLADGFNSHTIEYYVETKDGEDKQRIAQAQLSIDGMIDGKVNIRDREQVLEHYLEKIAGVYDSLYTAIGKQCAGEFKPSGKGTKPGSMS